MDTHGNEDGGPAPDVPDEVAAYTTLSQIALTSRPREETLHDVAVLAQQVLAENPETSVTLLSDGQYSTAAFSGPIALQLDERQYDVGYGPCLDAAVSGGIIPITMDDVDAPYPEFRRLAREHGVTHSLSVGLPAAGRTIGALNLYTSTRRSFTVQSVRIAGTFAGFAGIVLATVGHEDDAAAAAAQLQQALRSRAVISEAQGILMAERHCSREQAFTILVRESERDRVKLVEAAQALVDGTASPEPATATG